MDEAPPASPDPSPGHDPPADGSPPPPFVTGETSYAEQLKKSWWTRTSSYRMGERQFGLSAMLGLTVAVAVLFSIASLSGMGFLGFFVLLWIVAYMFGTLACAWGPQTLWIWVLFSWQPIRTGRSNPPNAASMDNQQDDRE